MLFSIYFIYNSKDIKGAILKSSHTKHYSEASGNKKIYGNKPYKLDKNKNNNKTKKKKKRDTHKCEISVMTFT